MKRVIALVLLLSGVMALFAFNVSAENTYVRELRNYSNSISAASLTYSVTAAQFGYVTESTLTGGMHSPILVTARLTNNGTQDVKIANSYIDLTFTTYSQVSAYDCYSSDLMVQVVKNGNDTPRYNVVASNGYSYGGHIVVPGLSSLYLVFEVDIEAHYDTSTASVVSPSLDAVLFYINSSDVVVGDYPTTGSIPEQLSEVEDTLYDLYTEQSLTRQQLISMYNDVHTLLLAIKNEIVTTHTYVLDKLNYNAINTATGYISFSNVNKEYNLQVFVTKPVPVTTSLAIDSLGGQSLQYNVYKSHVTIMLTLRGDMPLYYANFGLRYNSFGTAPIAVDNYNVTSTFSDFYSRSDTGSNFFLLSRYTYNSGNIIRNVIPSGYQSFTLSYDMYFDNDQTVTLTVPSNLSSAFIYGSVYEETNHNYISSDNLILNMIYQAMQSSSSSDISSGSNTLNQTESNVHQQEQLYFQQNAQAILDTGLSNYRFNTEQSNGIGAVSIDFTALWNALGSWNSVYVFALTLTIALTILRHAPNAISTVRHRNYDHNDRGS